MRHPNIGGRGLQGPGPNLQPSDGGAEGAERHSSEELPGSGLCQRRTPPGGCERVFPDGVHIHHGAAGARSKLAGGLVSECVVRVVDPIGAGSAVVMMVVELLIWRVPGERSVEARKRVVYPAEGVAGIAYWWPGIAMIPDRFLFRDASALLSPLFFSSANLRRSTPHVVPASLSRKIGRT